MTSSCWSNANSALDPKHTANPFLAPSLIPTPPPESPSKTAPHQNDFEYPSLSLSPTKTHKVLTDPSIITHYNNLLTTDLLLTPPIAAIESLISLLSASPPSTISETLSLLDSATTTLKSSVSNPVALSAGTDLFQRYIISTLQTRSALDAKSQGNKSSPYAGSEDFRAIRAHLLANSRLFVQRAKESRGRIAGVARRFVRDGKTVLTCGRSRVVAAVLNAASESHTRFRVIYAEDRDAPNLNPHSTDVVKQLRERHVPVATIPFAALATALPASSFAMVGAESVVENGGVISSMGTYQMGLLMKSVGKPLYVVAESHKFVRVYPLNGEDLPTGQGELDFCTEDGGGGGGGREKEERRKEVEVDFTPPELIAAIITEAGVQTPSAVSEELIKIWY